jgi:hypothetical protein
VNWHVDWAADALDALARCWLWSPDPNTVTAAQARIDQWLTINPHDHIEPAAEGLFTISAPPLRVVVQVDDASKVIRVVGVSYLLGPS